MPRYRASHVLRAQKRFSETLSPEKLDSLARSLGFVQRQRLITASSVFWALVVTVGAHATQYISDVLRCLNDREGWSVRYKPFWNRLAKVSFARFMKAIFALLCREMVTQVLQKELKGEAAYFSDILIDDGSSFAVADGLRRVFPGRFTKIKPAAVELHAHMSVVSDQVLSVVLAADKEGERQYLPPAESLPARSLSLRDRGYIDLPYFDALQNRNAYLICRARADLNPTVEKLLGVPPRIARRWCGKRLAEIPKSLLRPGVEATVVWQRPHGRLQRLRLIIRYTPPKRSQKRSRVKQGRRAQKNAWLLLLTNLPARFTADTVARLYRLRWQVELAFKEWKSYANLHALQSQHPAIVEGFIWASLCAAFLKRAIAHSAQLVHHVPVSTRIAAQAGPQVLPKLADWVQGRAPTDAFLTVLRFLAVNALRTHPERERRQPRRLLGLTLRGEVPAKD